MERVPTIAFFALVLLLSASNAITTQSAVIEASVTEVLKLIDVKGSLNWTEVLPGHEYASPIVISWAIPNEALRGLASKEVIIYVKVAKIQESQLYFKQGEAIVDEVYFNLTCANSNASCAEGSTLSKTIEVYSSCLRRQLFAS